MTLWELNFLRNLFHDTRPIKWTPLQHISLWFDYIWCCWYRRCCWQTMMSKLLTMRFMIMLMRLLHPKFFSWWCCCIHSVRAALTDRGWLDYHSHGQQPSTILRLCIISILILFAIECNLINRSIMDCRDLCFSPLLSKSCHFLGLLSRLKWGSEQRISVEAKLRLLSKCPPILFPLDWSVVRVCIPDILKQIRAV